MTAWLRRRLWRVLPPPRTEREALLRIRVHLAAVGCRVDRLTDEELVEEVAAMGRAIRAVGVPASKAMRNANKNMRAMNRAFLRLRDVLNEADSRTQPEPEAEAIKKSSSPLLEERSGVEKSKESGQ